METNKTTNNNNAKRSIDEALKHYGETVRFSPEFVQRLQQLINHHINAEHSTISPFEAMLQEIAALFPRFALAGLAAAAVLLFYNITSPEQGMEWTLDALLGGSAEITEIVSE
jgi:hypothetical protein